MTGRQNRFIQKMKDLLTYLGLQITKVEIIPAFKDAMVELAALVDEAVGVDQGRETTTSGQSKIIAAAKQKLVKAIFRLAGILSTFSYKSQMLDLHTRVTKSESDFARLSEGKLVEEGNEIIKLAEANQAGLPAHGLKETEIADAKAAVKEYSDSLLNRGQKDTKSVGETKTVYEVIGQIKRLLVKELDVHAKKYVEDDAEFYDGYKYNRTVIYNPAHHKTAAGDTTADTSSTPAQ